MQRPVSSKRLVSIEHEQPHHADIVVVNWCLGNLCNFRCSYCPEILHDGSIPWVDYETVIQFCQRAIDHYQVKEGSRLYVEFTGGEVSHYKHFIDVLKFLHERKVMNGMISNGSKAMSWWEQAKPYLDHVCLSYHSEFCKPDHFKKVLEFLNDTVTVHVNVMMNPRLFDQCAEMAEWVAANTKNVTIAIQPLLENFGDKMFPYTDAQKLYMQTKDFEIRFDRELKTYRGRMVKVFDDGSREVITGPQLVANHENSWAGWKCWAGVRELAINFDGSIYRAWCNEGGIIGNVRDKVIRFPSKPVVCKRSYCHCILDVMNHRTAPAADS